MQQATGEQATGEQATGEQATGEQATGEQATGAFERSFPRELPMLFSLGGSDEHRCNQCFCCFRVYIHIVQCSRQFNATSKPN